MISLIQIPCQHEGCTDVALSQPAYCYGCDKVLCQEHLDASKHHDCREIEMTYEKWDQSFEDALQDLNIEALHEELRVLRPGQIVTKISMPDITDIPEECHGGLNIHIPILFDDGAEWMLRLSGYMRDHPPFEVLECVKHSEVATMVALQSVSGLIPRVHGWGSGKLSKSGDRRCLYILTDLKSGKPCDDIFCQPDSASKTTKWKFIQGYAEHTIKLASLQFDSIGSLRLRGSAGAEEITVGPCIDLYSVSETTAPYFPGPFKTMRDRYIHHIDKVLDYTRKGLVGRGRPLLVYLAHLIARGLVANCAELEKEEVSFYIRQPDALTGQFLFVEGEITAVLDWEYANTTCKTHAFSAIEAVFGTQKWLHGDNAMTEGELMLCEAYEQRGRTDLADCVRLGRKYQRLEYIVGNILLFMYDGPTGEPYLVGMLNGLVDAFRGSENGPLPRTKSEWIEWALEQHASDPGMSEIMASEETSALYRSKVVADETTVSDEDVEGEVK